jgi:hypothetical protein
MNYFRPAGPTCAVLIRLWATCIHVRRVAGRESNELIVNELLSFQFLLYYACCDLQHVVFTAPQLVAISTTALHVQVPAYM